jgi:hypothetical protein
MITIRLQLQLRTANERISRKQNIGLLTKCISMMITHVTCVFESKLIEYFLLGFNSFSISYRPSDATKNHLCPIWSFSSDIYSSTTASLLDPGST